MNYVQKQWTKYLNLLKPIRYTKKSVLAWLVIPIIALAGAATVYAVTNSNAQTRATVAFVGDSNFIRGSGYLVSNLEYGPQWNINDHQDNNYTALFAVRSGSGIRSPDCIKTSTPCPTHNFWQTKLATTFSKSKPDVIVVDLGINDSPAPGTSTSLGYTDYPNKIDWFMKLLPAGKPVFWTNTPCQVEPADRKAGCQIINQALASAQSRWPNLTVINWGGRANAHPEYMTDQIHYSVTGYREFAKMITQALDARFPAP